MKISIIVPAFNEEKLIATSLREIKKACAAFSDEGWQTEIIVCDNNSKDRTAELSRAEGATVIFEGVNQIARARNSGARAAAGDWLIFIDADSHPSRALLADVAVQIRKGNVLAGGATVTLDQPFLGARLLLGGWNRLSRFKRWAAGSFIFCEAAAFRQIGGFSEELFVSEEIDLSKRLKILANQIGKRMVILHRHPLVTSARKIRLYSPWEHISFLIKTALGRGRTLRNRAACPIWYDGRR
ncbi:MAG: glycosyltransferase [Verrucomicrobiales bacterium]|nr:glycosyltransferase [Verrucomicrobiales bacterium]